MRPERPFLTRHHAGRLHPPITRGRAPYAIESVRLCKSELSREGARYSVLTRAVFDEKSGGKV